MFRDFVGVLSSRLSMTMLSLITSVIVARVLGAHGKGVLATVTAYSNFLVILLCAGLRQATAHFVGDPANNRRDVVATLMTMGIVFSLLGTGAAAWALLHLPTSKFDMALIALAVMVVPLSLAQNYAQGILVGVQNLPALNRSTVLHSLCVLTGIVVFVLCLPWGVHGAVGAQVLGGFGTVSFLVYALWPHIRVMPRFVPQIARSMLRLGVLAGTTLFLLNINLKIDVILLERMVSPAEVGSYSLGANLSEILLKVPAALGVVIWSRSAAGEAQLEQKVMKAIRVSVPFMIVGATGLGVAVQWLIPWVYGADFAEAVVATRWLLPGIVSMAVFNIIHHDLTGKGRPLLSLVALAGGAALNVALNLLLIPRYGSTGAAFASTLSYTLSAVTVTVLYVRAFSLDASRLYRFQSQDFAFLRRAAARFRRSSS